MIDGIFGGQLISTITCSQCQSVNQVFEGFLDLSLPIIEEKGVPPLLRGGAGDDKASENFLDVDSHSQSKRPVSKHMEKKKKKAAKREAKKCKLLRFLRLGSNRARGFLICVRMDRGSNH